MKIQRINPARTTLLVFICIFSLALVGVERETTNTVITQNTAEQAVNTQRSILDQWELSSQEWSRYEDLMEGIRGRLSHSNISPIEVLGIHARSDAERSHYARIWARMMRDDAMRVLQFQRAYDVEAQLLHQHEPLIDIDLLPEPINEELQKLSEEDSLLVFVRLDCPLCDIVFDLSYQKVSKLHSIEVYFVDAQAEESAQIRDWVSARAIDVEHLKTQKVTINFDNGFLDSIDPKTSSLPVIKRRTKTKIDEIQFDQLP